MTDAGNPASARVRLVGDVATLRAVSHPLRVQLLGALRADGPATPSELARRFATDSGSTSYHLRVLARHGFVEPAARRDARERRWQAVHELTSWDEVTLAATAQGREVVSQMRRRQVDALLRAIDGYEQAEPDPAWTTAAGMSDLLLRLTPGSLTALWQAFQAHAEELAAADRDDPAAVPVVLFAGGFPRLPEPS